MKLVLSMVLSVVAYEEEWDEFQAAQGSRNGDIPEAFKRNVDIVKAHNSQNSSWKLTYVGPFADLTPEEFKARYTGERSAESDMPLFDPILHQGAETELPASVDWEKAGACNIIKNQGSLDSCWAFAAVGSLESAWKIHRGTLPKLSEQQEVDCVVDDDYGYRTAGQDFLKNGACSSDTYKYTGKYTKVNVKGINEPWCLMSSCKLAIGKGAVTGHHTCESSPTGLKSALVTQPYAISVDSDQLQLYANGIVNAKCSGSTDHAVIAIGYGTESGTEYFRIRNSWGTGHGEAGYYRLANNGVSGGPACMFKSAPSAPTLSSVVV